VSVPSPSDGYRPVVPARSLGYPAESMNASTSPPSSRLPTRPSICYFPPLRETPRLHPVGCALLLPRPFSLSWTISENDSPGSDAPSHGDLSPDKSLRSMTADQQSDTGRRHRCPHRTKHFNCRSSLAIHVNTHSGDERGRFPAPSPSIDPHWRCLLSSLSPNLLSYQRCRPWCRSSSMLD
jgi:hypothetical protein